MQGSALIAGAGLTAVALLVGAALAAGDRGRNRDALPPLAAATAAPAPGAADAELLFDSGTVSRLRGGTWTAEPAVAAASSFLPPCEQAPDVEAVSGATRLLSGPAGSTVLHQVLTFPDEVRAIAAWKTAFLAVERCPVHRAAAAAEAATTRLTRVTSLPTTGQQRAYAGIATRECDSCAWRTDVFSYGQVGRRLVLVRLAERELESLPALAQAAEQRAQCGGGCSRRSPPTGPATSGEWDLAEAFLPVPKADAAGRPGWSGTELLEPDGAPLADPCGERSMPLPAEVLQAGETGLDHSEKPGRFVQEVYRYSSAAAAREAYLELAERFTRCAEVTARGLHDGTIRSERVGPQDAPGGDLELVRRSACHAGTCRSDAADFVILVRVGDALSVAELSHPGERELEDAGRLMSAVHDHLREVVRG